jgi:hypothetical protein
MARLERDRPMLTRISAATSGVNRPLKQQAKQDRANLIRSCSNPHFSHASRQLHNRK